MKKEPIYIESLMVNCVSHLQLFHCYLFIAGIENIYFSLLIKV